MQNTDKIIDKIHHIYTRYLESKAWCYENPHLTAESTNIYVIELTESDIQAFKFLNQAE